MFVRTAGAHLSSVDEQSVNLDKKILKSDEEVCKANCANSFFSFAKHIVERTGQLK